MAREISIEEMERISEPKRVIDIRSRDSFAKGSYPLSENLPLDELEPERLAAEGSVPLYLLCHTGQLSAALAETLEELGCEAYNIKGGYYFGYLRAQLKKEMALDPENPSAPKALIAMSGGVDSSLAAKLTRDAGYACVGCTMKLYDSDSGGTRRLHTCCSLDDIEDARSVAEEIGIPYSVFNFKDGFREQVIDRFAAAYESGRTPNPCIDCNRYMKFDRLFERAKTLGCDYVVTGHYARIQWDGAKFLLKKAVDDSKDQSYVLYTMTQEQLRHTLFPMGTMRKSEVRRLAEENHFINAAKPDSQDICFVPDGDYGAFLERQTGRPYPQGNFVDAAGNILGTHKGIVRYTIGQRKGLGLALGKPMYVSEIRPAENTVVLGEEIELYSSTLIAGEFNWISGEPPTGEIPCKAKIRYRQREQPAKAQPLPDGRVRVSFDAPQRAITPGQAVVLYDGDTILGGGTIETVAR